jgi:phytanoyl-CoA dioxygenase PhyH
MSFPLFGPLGFGSAEKAELDRNGHLVLPELLTPGARDALVRSLSRIQSLQLAHGAKRGPDDRTPNEYAAEHDGFLASLIPNPRLLQLARAVLGPDIRYDHCVALSRVSGYPGLRWHSHEYADDEPRLGFLRIFFYVNGFGAEDGGLKVVPGSHLLRDSQVNVNTDADLEATWLPGKRHPLTGEPLRMERLDAPPGSVILMWTHALHGVTPRRADNDTRWTVVYAYRNPGRPSRSRWVSDEFEHSGLPGTKGLMGLY